MNPETRRAAIRRTKWLRATTRAEARRGKRRCTATAKTRFPDFDSAVAAALRLSVTLGRPIRAYPCMACDGWHLTRRPTWKDITT